MGDTVRGSRGSGSSASEHKRRRRTVLAFVVGVVAIAAIIYGTSALGPGRGRDGSRDRESSDTLARRAMIALESGEVTASEDLANRALRADPNNEDAKAAIAAIAAERARRAAAEASSTPTPSPGAGGSTNGAGGAELAFGPGPWNEGFEGPDKAAEELLPKVVTGYALGVRVVDDEQAAVSGTPAASSSWASVIIWTVRLADSNSAALSFIQKTAKALYPKRAGMLAISGAPAYFGTDGAGHAMVVYVRGRYVFEVIVTGPTNDAVKLRRAGTSAAEAFRDTSGQ